YAGAEGVQGPVLAHRPARHIGAEIGFEVARRRKGNGFWIAQPQRAQSFERQASRDQARQDDQPRRAESERAPPLPPAQALSEKTEWREGVAHGQEQEGRQRGGDGAGEEEQGESGGTPTPAVAGRH